MSTGIITAASEKYSDSLFSLIGSLNCNWPNHPPLLVFDLGLSADTLLTLKSNNILVEKIPAFVDHWRLHYTWKLWCIKHAPFDTIIWMDSGILVLDSLDEIIQIINKRGYFLVPNYQFLDYEASQQACIGCNVDYSFRIGKGSIAGTIVGYSKSGKFNSVIIEAQSISLTERYIKASNSKHKHDQALISLITYRNIPNPELEDGIKYLGWASPRMASDQKIWLQRRNILKKDVEKLKRYLHKPGPKFIPKDPKKDTPLISRIFKSIAGRIKKILSIVIKKNKGDGFR
jgi:hypothetical protein